MNFPQMNRQPLRGIRIPEISGGLNLRDSVNLINDNQMADCLNMWYSDGALRTRPGLKYVGKQDVFEQLSEFYNIRYFDIFSSGINGKSRLFAYYQTDNSTNTMSIYFYWSDGIRMTKHTVVTLNTANTTFFVTKGRVKQGKEKIFLFAANEIYDITEPYSNTPLPSEEKYIPIVMTHCLSDISHNVSGTVFEGYNLINNRCKYIMSSFNKDILKDDDITHAMSYGLIYPPNTDLSQFKGQTVEVEYTFSDGRQETYTAVLDSAGKGKSTFINNMQLEVCGTYFVFNKVPAGSGSVSVGQISAKEYVDDNMVITQPCINTQENLDKIFLMKECEWFGGAASGLSGGTRLFLCGHEKEHNLLLWSGLNDPTYFSENCYAYVGSSNSSITAFGKQSNLLVIFKEYETYYTYYAENSNISADSLTSQSVIDYTANRVYFPIIQLNASIGCDCPGTVQLCRNRLVWTNSDGSVYTLVSNNQYNERSVFLVSDMIKPALKKELNLHLATACDWNGMYMLNCGERLYIMDYNSYGFQYVSSYSKQEDAGKQIPWYVWQFPLNKYSITFTVSNHLIYFTVVEEYGKFYTTVFSLNESLKYDSIRVNYAEDDHLAIVKETPIPCSCTTKFFDFNLPNQLKRVESVGISLGNECNLRIVFLTDGGNEEISVALNEYSTELRMPEYIQSVILNPCIRSVIRFGIKFESDSAIDIYGITLNYRMLGGAR